MNTEQLARMTVADIGDPLDYAHKAARGDIPTESEQMFRHARAQIQSALMLLDAVLMSILVPSSSNEDLSSPNMSVLITSAPLPVISI